MQIKKFIQKTNEHIHLPKILAISKEDRAWLAGVFDGVFVSSVAHTGVIRLGLHTNNLPLIEKMTKITGNKGHYAPDVFRMQFCGRNAMNFLKTVKKYSHCREKEIQTLEKFFKVRWKYPDDYAIKQKMIWELQLAAQENRTEPDMNIVGKWPEDIQKLYLEGFNFRKTKSIPCLFVKLGISAAKKKENEKLIAKTETNEEENVFKDLPQI